VSLKDIVGPPHLSLETLRLIIRDLVSQIIGFVIDEVPEPSMAKDQIDASREETSKGAEVQGSEML